MGKAIHEESGHYMNGHGCKHTMIDAFSCMTKIRKSSSEIVKIIHRTPRNFFTYCEEKERSLEKLSSHPSSYVEVLLRRPYKTSINNHHVLSRPMLISYFIGLMVHKR
jgi:2-hydroxy-3-keto-5-methylthiopentenyl-1-phosphate phosphatase